MTCGKCRKEQSKKLAEMAKFFLSTFFGTVITFVGMFSIIGGVVLGSYGFTQGTSTIVSPLAIACVISGVYTIWVGYMVYASVGRKKNDS